MINAGDINVSTAGDDNLVIKVKCNTNMIREFIRG
jgi:hypothetical protein